MFEHVFIPVISAADDTEGPVDLGQLVEAMLFYDRVSLAINGVVPQALLRAWGPNGLLALLEEEFVVLTGVEKQSMVLNFQQGTSGEFYQPGLATIRDKSGRVRPTLEVILGTDAFAPFCNGTNSARRTGANVRRLSKSYSLDESVTARMAADFRDREYVRGAVMKVLAEVAPTYVPPPNMLFELWDLGDNHFRLRTDIDWRAAEAAFALAAPRSHQTLNASMLLATIAGTREALEAGALLDAELATSPLSSALVQGRVSASVTRRLDSNTQISLFAQMTLESGNAIREAVNSGERSFEEIIALLRRARTFREWLRGAPPEAGLLAHYYQSLRSGSWLESLPVKAFRWSLFTGLGALGPLGGFGGSVIDSFLLDRLLKGWKPSQFVDGPLRRFVSATERGH
ncbi:MAG: hypothetical protein H7Z74_03005 [Anaerolineae bacterium]|nr:hypothetical protein [Gemmatimonadaceae bacterium]